jgi:hypothetical protein
VAADHSAQRVLRGDPHLLDDGVLADILERLFVTLGAYDFLKRVCVELS